LATSFERSICRNSMNFRRCHAKNRRIIVVVTSASGGDTRDRNAIEMFFFRSKLWRLKLQSGAWIRWFNRRQSEFIWNKNEWRSTAANSEFPAAHGNNDLGV
jgi:hypothetical protein